MKKTFLAILATAAALFARSASAETVQIANAADWATFADRVNSGETTLDAEMTANVTLTQDSPRVGTEPAAPGLVTQIAAAMLARRMQVSSGISSVSPPMKKPVKVSPAAVVSTAGTEKAFCRTVSISPLPTR